jgi:hypothetical protein
MLRLNGKRAVFVEELEPHRKLAEGSIKEWTGNVSATLSVRPLYKESFDMRWRAKIVIGVNHGKICRFDPYDEPLVKRMLVIPHVSCFTTDSSQWDVVRNVYPMNTMLPRIACDEFRLVHMLWCLEGYRKFRQLGLGDETLHASILDFKKAFVHKNSPVYVFLGEILEVSPRPIDLLIMDNIWVLYQQDKRAIKWLTKEQFTVSFKVLVDTIKPGAFQETTVRGRRTLGAVGLRVKDHVLHSKQGSFMLDQRHEDGSSRVQPYLF